MSSRYPLISASSISSDDRITSSDSSEKHTTPPFNDRKWTTETTLTSLPNKLLIIPWASSKSVGFSRIVPSEWTMTVSQAIWMISEDCGSGRAFNLPRQVARTYSKVEENCDLSKSSGKFDVTHSNLKPYFIHEEDQEMIWFILFLNVPSFLVKVCV